MAIVYLVTGVSLYLTVFEVSICVKLHIMLPKHRPKWLKLF